VTDGIEKQVVVVGHCELPSPIFKKEIRWSEVKVKRVKNMLLKMVMSMVGLENNLWLKERLKFFL
jgi:hypothetical protein